jgi:hypothetical protein
VLTNRAKGPLNVAEVRLIQNGRRPLVVKFAISHDASPIPRALVRDTNAVRPWC